MPKPAHFRVDPKLTALLGESYRSSEEALKELVDNAWDADAETVTITLPGVLDGGPIVIEDDGSGMIEKEVRDEYLRIASDRTSRKGDRTILKRRKVKGRKGIGKFAGLMAAHEMRTETWSRGLLTSVAITKPDLLAAQERATDLERVDLPVVTRAVPPEGHGTRITLSGLNQRFQSPSPEKLRALLIREYGREDGFRVVVNDVAIAMEDVPGTPFAFTTTIEGIGAVTLRFTICDDRKVVKQSGIGIRVGGKLIGRASSFGLEDDELIPSKLLKRVYGEIEADGLVDNVTADWGAVIENSRAFQELGPWVAANLKQGLEATFKSELDLAKARWERELQRRLAALPEHRRRHAEDIIQRLLRKLYKDSADRVEAVVSVMLDAFERDDYWVVLKSIDAATRDDVGKLAGILGELGLVDLAIVAQQVKNRYLFLDEFDALISNPSTLESQVHEAIERNLWLLGPGYRIIASNKTLEKLVADWAGKKFQGKRANKRPDVLLLPADRDTYLLIEFKRPSHAITRDDENQAIKYRDDLQPFLPDKKIAVLMVGGTRAPTVSLLYSTSDLKVTTFRSLVAQARDDLGWMLEQLQVEG